MLYQGQVQKNLLKLISFHLPQTANDSHCIVDPIKKQLNTNHREIEARAFAIGDNHSSQDGCLKN